MQSIKLGDQFAELIQQVTAQNIQPLDVQTFQRTLNELDDRDQIIKSWFGPGSKIPFFREGIRSGTALLDMSGLQIYNPVTAALTTQIQNDGDVLFGSDLSSPATSGLLVFSNDQTYNGESVGAGDVMIGDNSSGKPNIFWDKSAGQLSIRIGTIVTAYLSGSSSFAQIGVSVTSSAFSLTSGSVTAAPFDTEVFDDASFWTAGDPTKITIPYTGRYEFQVRSQFTNNTAGQRFTYYDKNSGTLSLQHCGLPTTSTFNTIYTDIFTLSLTAGDYVEIKLMQNSGSTINGQVNLDVKRVK